MLIDNYFVLKLHFLLIDKQYIYIFAFVHTYEHLIIVSIGIKS